MWWGNSKMNPPDRNDTAFIGRGNPFSHLNLSTLATKQWYSVISCTHYKITIIWMTFAFVFFVGDWDRQNQFDPISAFKNKSSLSKSDHRHFFRLHPYQMWQINCEINLVNIWYFQINFPLHVHIANRFVDQKDKQSVRFQMNLPCFLWVLVRAFSFRDCTLMMKIFKRAFLPPLPLLPLLILCLFFFWGGVVLFCFFFVFVFVFCFCFGFWFFLKKALLFSFFFFQNQLQTPYLYSAYHTQSIFSTFYNFTTVSWFHLLCLLFGSISFFWPLQLHHFCVTPFKF